MPTVLGAQHQRRWRRPRQRLESRAALTTSHRARGTADRGQDAESRYLIGSLGALRNLVRRRRFRRSLDQRSPRADRPNLGGRAIGGRLAKATWREQLKPILQDAVKVAQSIQQLLNVRLSCPDGVTGASASASATPPPPPPGQPAPPTRIATTAQQVQQLDSALAVIPSPIDADVLLQLLLMMISTKPRDDFFSLNVPVLDDFVYPLQTLVAWSAMNAAEVATHLAGSLSTLTARVREGAAIPLTDLATTLNTTAPQWRRAALTAAADAIAAGAALDAALQLR